MNVRKIIGMVAALGLVTTAALAGPEHDHAHATIGKPAPDFKLTSSDGAKVKLSDLRGKVVVLEWTNHECPYVVRHVGKKKTMQTTFAKFKGKDVAWLGIDSSHFCEDKKTEINAFRKASKVDYPTLLDANGKVGHIYGAKTTPHMFVIDKKGILVYSGAIDDDRAGDKDQTRNYVAEAVEAALTGSTVPTSQTRPYGCGVKYAK
jgi:peroxiredoxin